MAFVVNDLLQIAHPLGRGGIAHDCRMGVVNPEARFGSDKVLQFLDLFRCFTMRAGVHGKHAAALAAAKGCVHQIVVEGHDISWL